MSDYATFAPAAGASAGGHSNGPLSPSAASSTADHHDYTSRSYSNSNSSAVAASSAEGGSDAQSEAPAMAPRFPWQIEGQGTGMPVIQTD